MTRILDSDTPVVAASAKRTMCGIWVADHMVICSLVGSTTTERGSMNAGISRCWRYSRSMTTPPSRALAIASSTLPPVPASSESNFQNADLLVPRSGWARVSSAAAFFRSTAAGSSSYSTSTSSAASRASAAVRATMTATISPAKLTRSERHRQVHGGDLVGGDRPGVDQAALALAEVGAGEDRHHVGGALGLALVDRGDGGVGEGAAHHGEVEHARQHDVVGPAGAPGDEALVLLAAAVAPDLHLGPGAALLGRGHDVISCPAACCTALTMLW